MQYIPNDVYFSYRDLKKLFRKERQLKKATTNLYKNAIFLIILSFAATGCANKNKQMGEEAYPDYNEPSDAPAWPLPFTEEDAPIVDETPREFKQDSGTGFSGGADLTPPGGMPPVTDGRIPPENSKMPLANKSLGKDDGTKNLAASNPPSSIVKRKEYTYRKKTSKLEEKSRPKLENQVRDWVAKEGYTLREVLEEWAKLEGWKVVWATNREYPLQAGVIFRGRFTDVTSAIIRTFSIATPPPYAKFFFGNKTLVVKTLEDENVN